MLSRRVVAYYGLIRASAFLPAAYGFRNGGGFTQGTRLEVGIQRVPNLLRGTGLTCRLPYPGGPKGARGCCFPSGVSLHPFVKGSATTLVVSRLQSSRQVTARELASPPFEDVYVRAGTDAGHPESASNMTTWVNSQFPRPDFHRRVHRHYGLHNKLRPKPPRHTSTLHHLVMHEPCWGGRSPKPR